jgi:tetraacyldisaccharide 4'-kinase
VLEKMFLAAWYGASKWTYVLWPLMLVYRYVVVAKRKAFLVAKNQATNDATDSGSAAHNVPVIVVGNITVGGTGKTPIVQSLVRYLIINGYTPGIISRGYGGSLDTFPYLIQAVDSSALVGDEPYMLSHSLGVPVVIDPKRKNALKHIVSLGVDVVISDDGMQHYELPRDIEICVIDGARGLGNQKLIPVGPLREPLNRLDSVDFNLESSAELSNNTFLIEPVSWVNVKAGARVSLDQFKVDSDAVAIAGIGNPGKFFNTLKVMGVKCKCMPFSDHHPYTYEDTDKIQGQILMTEKDSVKIRPFARDDMWYLEISAKLSDTFYERFAQKLNEHKFTK